jgi:hypothetical protein
LLPETLGRDLSAKGFKVDTETEATMKAASVSSV